MRSTSLMIILLLPLFALCSFDNGSSMLNRPMPLLHNKTLDGKTIDESYYKGHVSLVSFMYIGCMGCMSEINSLNKLNAKYSSNEKFHMLCIARQMKEQMEQFNSDKKSMFNTLRSYFGAGPIQYSIQPGCSGTSKMDSSTGRIDLKSECNTVEETYGFSTYPTLFIVDKKGIIREIKTGAPAKGKEQAFYDGLEKEINELLAEE